MSQLSNITVIPEGRETQWHISQFCPICHAATEEALVDRHNQVYARRKLEHARKHSSFMNKYPKFEVGEHVGIHGQDCVIISVEKINGKWVYGYV